jgi:hypothetical protein
MTALRLSYQERYRAEQRGYLERGLDLSYAYAKRAMSALLDQPLSAELAHELSNLRAAMATRQPIAAILDRLFLLAPTAFP